MPRTKSDLRRGRCSVLALRDLCNRSLIPRCPRLKSEAETGCHKAGRSARHARFADAAARRRSVIAPPLHQWGEPVEQPRQHRHIA